MPHPLLRIEFSVPITRRLSALGYDTESSCVQLRLQVELIRQISLRFVAPFR